MDRYGIAEDVQPSGQGKPRIILHFKLWELLIILILYLLTLSRYLFLLMIRTIMAMSSVRHVKVLTSNNGPILATLFFFHGNKVCL